MDVIALHQAGFSNAVATLGTAITADQARLIRLYGEEAVIAYDADNAGQAATLKAINLLSDAGVNTRVLQLKDAKDPDEYIKKFGAQAFLERLEDAGGAVEFELKRLSSGLDLESAADRTLYLKKAVELLASITSELERTVYISEVARQTQTLHDNVKQLVEAQIKRKYYAQKRNEERQLLHPRQQPDKLNPEEHKFPTEAKAEKGIIAYLLHSPELLSYITQTISEEDFPTSFHKKVFEILKNKIKHGESVELSALNGEFSTEEMGKIIGIQRENALLPFTKQRLSEYLAVLKRYTEQKHKKDPSQMTPQELQDYIKALSEKKVPKGTEHERRQ
jgi:DNA primase